MSDKVMTGRNSRFGKLFCDEEQAHESVVNLSSGRTLTENDVPSSTKYMTMLFPGVEGSCAVMKPLAGNLKGDVYCIQYTVEVPDTPDGIIQFAIDQVKLLIKENTKITLIGYSYGGWLAMEVTHFLEQREGKKVNLILIDSSPDFLKAVASIWYKNWDDDELQIYVVSHYLKLIAPETCEQALGQLRNLKTFNSRVNLALAITASKKDYSENYRKAIIEGMYRRAKVLSETKAFPERSLNCPVTIIKPSKSKMTVDDYGLSKYCTTTVDKYVVDGNHFSILEDEKLAEIIINKILEIYEKQEFTS